MNLSEDGGVLYRPAAVESWAQDTSLYFGWILCRLSSIREDATDMPSLHYELISEQCTVIRSRQGGDRKIGRLKLRCA